MVEVVKEHQRFSVAVWKKRHLEVLRIKLTFLVILIAFFIRANHEFSQIALLEVCTLAHQDSPTYKILFKRHKKEMYF